MVRSPHPLPHALARGIEVLRWRFAASANAPRIARGLLADVVPEDFDLTIAQLLASELITNAILHTRRPGELRVSLANDLVRIEVRDTVDMPPRLKHEVGVAGGWGLRIVTALSNGWGVERSRGGKNVWFELRRGDARMDD